MFGVKPILCAALASAVSTLSICCLSRVSMLCVIPFVVILIFWECVCVVFVGLKVFVVD